MHSRAEGKSIGLTGLSGDLAMPLMPCVRTSMRAFLTDGGSAAG